MAEVRMPYSTQMALGPYQPYLYGAAKFSIEFNAGKN